MDEALAAEAPMAEMDRLVGAIEAMGRRVRLVMPTMIARVPAPKVPHRERLKMMTVRAPTRQP
jgi:hypothetical protein